MVTKPDKKEIGTFWQRVADLQEENPTIAKSGHNKHLKYHYALIDDILVKYKPLLTKHGLVLYNNLDAEKQILTTILQNAHGDECLSTTYGVNTQTTDQKIGASLTYGRRYNAGLLLNIATDEDTDGFVGEPDKKSTYNNDYSKPATKTAPKKETPKAPTFTKDQQQSNFAEHYEKIKSSKNLKELQDSFIAFNKAGKVVGYVEQKHVDEMIELKDAMKNGFSDPQKATHEASVDISDEELEPKKDLKDKVVEAEANADAEIYSQSGLDSLNMRLVQESKELTEAILVSTGTKVHKDAIEKIEGKIKTTKDAIVIQEKKVQDEKNLLTKK